MKTHHEVISAFIDDETVAPEDLRSALATAEGRAFLIDALVLRRLTRSDDKAPVVPISRPKTRLWRHFAVAAALILAAVATFQLGHRYGLNATMRAPEPTRVISAGPAWQEDSALGGAR